jgi:hypothetical protein
MLKLDFNRGRFHGDFSRRQRRSRKLAMAGAAVAAGFGIRSAAAATDNAVWVGGTDVYWGTAANWSPAVVPNNGTGGYSDFNVSIGAPSPTVLNITAAIDNLTVSSSGILDIPYNNPLSVNGGSLTDNGSIVVNSNTGGAVADLNFGVNTTISGTGTITLQQSGNNSELTGAAGVTITQSAGHTIAGYGAVNLPLINNGTVTANANGQILYLNGAVTNDSVLKAVSGGNLLFNGVSVTQAAGSVTNAATGSLVVLNSGTFTGGTITSAGTGAFQISGTSMVSSVTNTGTINIPYGNQLNMSGTIADSGSIVVNSNTGGAVATLNFSTGSVITGTGSITLQQPGQNAQLDGSLNQSAGHTIQGYGNINATLLNNGTVNANINGNTLTLQPATATNNSLFEATGGGGLSINGTAVTQAATAQILAGNGSVVTLTNATIVGGNLSSAANTAVAPAPNNAGSIYIANGATAFNSVNNTAVVNVPYNSTLTINGNLLDNGTINVNSNTGGAIANLNVAGGVISGSGTIFLEQGSSNARLNGSLNQSAGHTISGYGTIYATLVNKGLITANVAGQTLSIDSPTILNQSNIQASAGTLYFETSVLVNNSTGTITASAASGGITLANGTNISGGSITTVSPAVVTLYNYNATAGYTALLNNMTITAGTTVNIPYNNTLDVTGATFTNNGTIVVDSNTGGAVAQLNFNTSSTLTGTGSVVLKQGSNNAQLNAAPGTTLTQDVNHSLTGFGTIAAALVNNNIVNANVNGQTLTLNSYNMTNNAIFEATNGATLSINNITVAQSASATTTAAAGSLVYLNGAAITGGTVATAGTGGVTINGAVTFNSLNSSAAILLPYDQTLTINGNFGDNGTLLINQDGGGAVAQVTVNGGAVSGTGIWTINGYMDNAQIDGTLTQSAGHSIVGYGAIEAALTNNGLVNANVAGQTIFLQGSNKSNNSLVESTGGGGVTVSGVTLTQAAAASLNSGAGSSVTINNATVTGGTINGPGYTINGNSTLSSLTTTAAILVPYSNTLNLTGSIVDNGSILINQNGGGAIAQLNSSASVTGTGTWTLNAYQNNAEITGALTQGAGHSIVGYGSINATLTNAGTINANSSGQTLFVTAATTNTNLLEATTGGILNVTGNTITQGAGNTITAASSSAVVFSNLTAVATTITGLGTVTVNAGVFSGTVSNGGNLIIGGLTTGNGPLVGTGGTTVNAGATFSTTMVRQSYLTVNGTATIPVVKPYVPANTVNVIGTLSMAAGGMFDIGDSDLDLTSSSLANVNSYLKRGYNLSIGGVWAGTGLTSAAARSSTTHLTALGSIQNNQGGAAIFTSSNKFDGLTVGAGDVLVKYTFYGDANLDGKIDGSDYSLIDAGYLADKATAGSATGWYHGDFNYDGTVDGSDYTLIDNAFNNQAVGVSNAAEVASETAQVAPAAVPEPASAGLLCAAAGFLACRRRRTAF